MELAGHARDYLSPVLGISTPTISDLSDKDSLHSPIFFAA